jgi:hypothetical protein
MKEVIAMGNTAAKITSIMPVAGPVGTAVTIAGTGLVSGLDTRPDAFLNGSLMVVTAASETSVTALVPSVPDGTSSPIALQIGDELVWSDQQFSVIG